MRLSLGRRLFYSLIPLVALLALVEIGFRLFPHRDAGIAVANYTMPDPDMIWRLRPTAGGPAATNDLGLRDDPFNGNADYKILLLGDSVSWGHRVTLQQTFASRLERALNEIDPGVRFEVINAGVPGYSTFQQEAYLRIHGLALEPDLIVLQFCLNDVVERYQRLAAYGGDNIFLGVDTREGISGFFGFLIRHSRTVERMARGLQAVSRNREEYEVEKLARDELSPELIEAWEVVLGEVEAIRQTALEHQIPLFLAIAPYRFQLADAQGLRQPQDRLIEYAETNNLPYLDWLPDFAEQPAPTTLFLDPSHLSARGHEEASRLLLDPVVKALETGVLFKVTETGNEAALEPSERAVRRGE